MPATSKTAAKFPLGQVASTPGALEAFDRNGQVPITFIARHQSGDWGDLSEDDKRKNALSVEKGFRILSAYHLNDGTKIWVITEADRSSTCLLLPEEY